MARFDGQLHLVVGASSGIGLAVAQRLATEGATVVGVARGVERLEAAVQQWPGAGHRAIVADVTAWDQLQPVIQAGKEGGGYAGCVVCAGMHEMRPLAVLDAASLTRSLQANVHAALLSTRALAKAARAVGASVVWLSSVAALRGSSGFIGYAAAKGALLAAVRAAAVELAPRKIRVNVVAAGVVRTPMSDGWLSLLKPEQLAEVEHNHLLGLGQPEHVAGAIAFLLSEDARWITGSRVTIDGGLSAH